jgi:hypothetical protein
MYGSFNLRVYCKQDNKIFPEIEKKSESSIPCSQLPTTDRILGQTASAFTVSPNFRKENMRLRKVTKFSDP